MHRLSRIFAASLMALVSARALAQEPVPPAPPAPPEPPRAETPSPFPRRPTTPRPALAPRASRERRVARGRQDALTSDALGRLRDATSLDRLLEEAAQATDLDKETVRPAVTALHSLISPEPNAIRVRSGDTTIMHKRLSEDGHQTTIIRNGPVDADERVRIETAEARFRETVGTLPAEKRDAFFEWAATKRAQISDLAASIAGDASRSRERADEDTRAALESLVLAEKEMETARSRLDLQGLDHQVTEMKALADARKALEEQNVYLADQLARLGRERIETTLDRSLYDRYRALAGDVDRDTSRRMVENLLKTEGRRLFADTRPLGGTAGIEARVTELQAQRAAIDNALEQATTELVRERAMKLEEEARKIRAEETRARRKVEAGSNDLPPEKIPTPQAEYEAEIRRLRDELQALRQEVEALRRKK